ncbi:hypothetical protein ACTNDZ_12380 [Selenomonas montiformis]|uniref:hypothetical protein n=1 Tax=Selenomonas montiformis TaxID=2652285 RepID=UPI003F8977ED
MKNFDYVRQLTSHEMGKLFENVSNNKCSFCIYRGKVVCKCPADKRCRDGFQAWLITTYVGKEDG